MSPQDYANLVLTQYWDKTIPLDPAKIAISMGLKVYTSEQLGPHAGYYNAEEKHIVINANDALPRQRFTIAHELAHHVMKHGSSHRGGTQDVNPHVEQLADSFAAEILMPQEAVRFMVENKNFNFQQLINAFNVSSTAMHIRLKELRLI